MKLIDDINKFKIDNSQYDINSISDSTFIERDGFLINSIGQPTKIVDIPNDSAFYYICSFYLSEKKILFRCQINVSIYVDSIPSYLLFSQFRIIGNQKWININTDDLSKKENREIKRIFETEILNKIDSNWRKE